MWDKISLLFYSNPPTTYYYYWPYYLFILVGTFISLYLVREKDFGRGPETNISVENVFEIGLFYSPAIIAFLALILNTDLLLIITIIVWFKFMGIIWKRNYF